ncbi:MAG: SMP-30/gluconolactonase/LRE family protein [Verrucomicrobiae bacterium]|nr:SMP-30/gluconolactonase/LRE family protein [Verrucomicrobiae bacterium]
MKIPAILLISALTLAPHCKTFGESNVLSDYSQLTKIADGYSFTEGGTSDEDGNIYFTDSPNNRVHKWNPKTNQITTYISDTLAANGTWMDRKGNLIVCEGKGRSIAQYSPGGKRTVLVDSYEGKKFNSPNDLWVDLRGGIYFSDPRYGQNRDDMEMSGEHVYYLTPTRDKVIRVADDMVRPNGLVGTPDGRFLFISDHGGRKTWKYNIRKDGTLRNKTLFVEEGSDGVTLDHTGNLYLTSGTVKIYNSNGTFLEEIETPKAPSNVVFGGENGDLLFITARDTVYFIRTKVKGASAN